LKLRGILTIGIVGSGLVLAEVIQRTVVVGLVRLLPRRRDRILGRWQLLLAHFFLGTVKWVGGARLDDLPSFPGRPGVLVLMNHQSLLDIPLVVASQDGLYPRIVTRARYASGKPLISHMIRLYQYPLVDSRATVGEDLARIREAARTSTVPIMIYPEGHRTRDGRIRPFKAAGLRAILQARTWEVWIVVADGFWRGARLDDFLEHVSDIEGSVRVVGPSSSPEPGSDTKGFIREMRRTMVETLADMRDEPPKAVDAVAQKRSSKEAPEAVSDESGA